MRKSINRSSASLFPSPSPPKDQQNFMIPAPSEPFGNIEMYSPQFYTACTVGGILSCGLTHMTVTPLDLVKCNMQIDPVKYKSISSGFGVLLKEQGVRGFFRGWVPTLFGYSTQGACKFGFYIAWLQCSGFWICSSNVAGANLVAGSGFGRDSHLSVPGSWHRHKLPVRGFVDRNTDLAMESDTEHNNNMMIDHNVPHNMQIDPSRSRFPCCIVWTPLPVVSWLLPFVGHIGIGREDGVILDFAGPNFVCVDNFTFGAVARYVQISKDKCSITPHQATMYKSEEEYDLVESGIHQHTWDDVLRKSTQEYQHHSYNILTCNCHSFVANNLNKLEFQGGGWNVVNVASMILMKGKWVSKRSMIQAYLPFVIIFLVGITFGGANFLAFLGLFAFVLVGWYVLGTYCFKKIIEL